MTTIPQAAIEAAAAAIYHHFGNAQRGAEAAILAALPHLGGEPVAWTSDWQIELVSRHSLGNIGPKFEFLHPIPLYLAPPAPAVSPAREAVTDQIPIAGVLDRVSITNNRLDDIAGMADAPYLDTSAPIIPADWKLVPVEPTPEMIRNASYLTFTPFIYQAMVAAAPEPPVVYNEPTSGSVQAPLPITGAPQAAAQKIDERVFVPETAGIPGVQTGRPYSVGLAGATAFAGANLASIVNAPHRAHDPADTVHIGQVVPLAVAEQMAEALRPFAGDSLPSVARSTIRIEINYRGERTAMNDRDRAFDKARAALAAYEASKTGTQTGVMPE